MSFKLRLCFFYIIVSFCCTAQEPDSNTVIRFDFNDHQIKENNDQVMIKPVGVELVADRFGNPASAVITEGYATSYINLGSSKLIKPVRGTVSLWVSIRDAVLAGKGYEGNIFLIIKNGPGEDFIIGFGMGYDYKAKRLGTQASKDSIQEVGISSREPVKLNTWYHLVTVYDDNYFSCYLNGELQGKLIKGFRSCFTESDSVVLGRTTGPKNVRYTMAVFDDLRFFHRPLSEKEVLELYHEPNPNKLKNLLLEIAKYSIALLAVAVIVIIIMIRNRRKLKRQKEYFEMSNRINELEIKAIKSQMNPHFISNSMSAIQELIYSKAYEKASQYIAKLGLLMRQILDYSDKTYISLDEELGIMRLNVELEQLRFDNEFSFSLNIEDGIDPKEVLIPSLITQPFIENAIWHGLLPLKSRAPKLTVTIYSHNNITFIAIEDNGVGRSNTKTSEDSKGTRLVTDKLEALNRINKNNDFRLTINDLFDEHQKPAGTNIIIQLLNTPDE